MKNWTDGKYLCHCIFCKSDFNGPKRANVCNECSNPHNVPVERIMTPNEPEASRTPITDYLDDEELRWKCGQLETELQEAREKHDELQKVFNAFYISVKEFADSKTSVSCFGLGFLAAVLSVAERVVAPEPSRKEEV